MRRARGFGFEEIAQRHGDFALAAAACRARVADGTIIGIDIGLGGVEDRPIVVELSDIAGQPADDPSLPRAAGQAVLSHIDPLSDHIASSEQRRCLACTLGARAAAKAIANARMVA